MLTTLKNETRDLHTATENENLANKIIDKSISKEEFHLLLLQNYVAYALTENAIADNLDDFQPEKAAVLQKDLKNLSIQSPNLNNYTYSFSCKNSAEALGAQYVVEGSALGGMVIAKHLKKCPPLANLPTQNFFSGKRENLADWKKFQNKMEEYSFTASQKEQMLEKAKETFNFFRKVFQDKNLKKYIPTKSF
ncbi:biliverdin-producing heme oxygenase [Haloflavibacter putidus]|uniref:Biliverdin-producing heme oxygenase n=1 Tax=Haloflavibacter putidus TaxID=2576776 RepID=A0A507ZGZ9_9FLAO|nr:biliverdin-producing heme oxygenase [Haloflavibacter putidus]TQD35394.1 biliverdin-producing heme oxygenase [Haloflavibacter putidus]